MCTLIRTNDLNQDSLRMLLLTSGKSLHIVTHMKINYQKLGYHLAAKATFATDRFRKCVTLRDKNLISYST